MNLYKVIITETEGFHRGRKTECFECKKDSNGVLKSLFNGEGDEFCIVSHEELKDYIQGYEEFCDKKVSDEDIELFINDISCGKRQTIDWETEFILQNFCQGSDIIRDRYNFDCGDYYYNIAIFEDEDKVEDDIEDDIEE